MMKNITENLPLLTVVLIIVGFLKLISFYSFFGVDIVSYLDVTEIIQLEFKFFAISFLAIVLFLVYLILKADKPDKANSTVGLNYKRSNFGWVLVNYVPIFISINALIMIVSIVIDRIKLHIINTFHVDMAVFFVLIFFLPIVVNRIQKNLSYFSPNAANYLRFSSIFVPLIAIVLIVSRNDAYMILTERPDKEAVLVLEKRTISTGKNLIYIGKTRNYVFLYDKNFEQAEVVPVDKITDSYFKAGKSNKILPNSFKVK